MPSRHPETPPPWARQIWNSDRVKNGMDPRSGTRTVPGGGPGARFNGIGAGSVSPSFDGSKNVGGRIRPVESSIP